MCIQRPYDLVSSVLTERENRNRTETFSLAIFLAPPMSVWFGLSVSGMLLEILSYGVYTSKHCLCCGHYKQISRQNGEGALGRSEVDIRLSQGEL